MDKGKCPDISVIITTFNSEHYISRITSSVETFFLNYSYEIIFIDDNSKDATVRVIQKLMKKNHRIKLITKKTHKGVSNSRNLGLNISSGKYIMFCDDDDELLGTLPEIKLHSDIISFSQYANSAHSRKESLISDMFGFNNTRKGYSGFNGGCYSKLFSRKMLCNNSIRFNEKLTDSEDVLFNVEAILKSNTIKSIRQGIYKYNLRKGSTTHKKNTYLLKNHLLFINDMSELFNSFHLSNSLLLKIKSLYLYQLVFRYFVYSSCFKKEYIEYYNQCFENSNAKWNANLNRIVEISTINIVNNFGIRAAVIFAKLYLNLKHKIKLKENQFVL